MRWPTWPGSAIRTSTTPRRLSSDWMHADYFQLEAYYDRGSEVMSGLSSIGAVRMEAPWRMWDGQGFPDYYEFEENKAVRGRGLQCVATDGGAGNGAELVRQLMAFCAGRGSPVRLEHRVVDLVVEDGIVRGRGGRRRCVVPHGAGPRGRGVRLGRVRPQPRAPPPFPARPHRRWLGRADQHRRPGGSCRPGRGRAGRHAQRVVEPAGGRGGWTTTPRRSSTCGRCRGTA